MPAERVHVYQPLRPLDRGGPGRVRVARALAGGPFAEGDEVALREVTPDDVRDERVLAWLEETHAAARSIRSGAVVAARDHGTEATGAAPRFWSAAPFVEGPTLAALLRSADVVPDLLTEAVLTHVAEALEAVHAAGLVGIGLSPESILLRPDGSAALLDPGFGPAVGPLWPAAGRPPAAMMCAAPEVLRGSTPDARSDLFALGALVFRCMTGAWHRPEDAKALLYRCAEMDAVRPSDVRAGGSQFLGEVVAALLCAAREQRVSGAAELRAILRDRRRGAWWASRAAGIAGSAADADSATAAPPPPPAPPRTGPPLPPVPAPARAPDDAWWAARLRSPHAARRHAAPCLGRDAEIDALLLHALEGSRSGVVFVEGEAGSGKTRLLDAFVERLGEVSDRRAPWVLRGECRQVGIGRPLGPFTEAITAWLRGERVVGAGDVAPLLGAASAIAPSLAAVLSSEDPPPGAPPLSRSVVAEACLRILRAMGERRPVVLVLEDLQWADPEARDLLAFLARSAALVPLLVVGAHRPGHDEAIAPLRESADARTLRLAPLPPERIAELAAALVSPPEAAADVAARLHAAGATTPGAVVEAVGALAAEGCLTRADDGRLGALPGLARAGVPASAAEAAARRYAHLDDSERALLAAAAVQGVAFDADVARRAAGFEPRTADELLGRLVRDGILTGEGVARRFACDAFFDHVQSSLDDVRLAALHEATADAFLASRNPEQLPPSRIHGILSTRVAWHYLLAGRPARGLLYLDASLAHLRSTLRHGDGDRLTAVAARALAADASRGADHVDVLLHRAEFLAAQGRTPEVRDVLDEALLRARERLDLGREARALLEQARARLAEGDAVAADEDARQALACAHRASDDAARQRIHLWMAESARRESRWQDARTHCLEALEFARRTSDDVAESEIHDMLGAVAQALGLPDEAEAELAAALSAHRARHDLSREAVTLTRIADLAVASGDAPRAEAALRRALSIQAAMGDGAGEVRTLAALARVLQDDGRLAEARDAHGACLERARRLGAPASEVVALVNTASVDAWLGRLDEARDAYGQALVGARNLGDGRLQGWALTGLGEIARHRGHSDVARDLLGRAVLQFRMEEDPVGLAAALLAAGRLDLFLGRSDTGASLLQEALRLAEQQDARQLAAVSRALLALVAARRRDGSEADQLLAEASLAISEVRASDATRLEVFFLHSLALRVLGRAEEADRRILQAEATMLEAVRSLADEDCARVFENLSPHREVLAGADAARARAADRTPCASDTVAV